jgi:hypothetical protein
MLFMPSKPESGKVILRRRSDQECRENPEESIGKTL